MDKFRYEKYISEYSEEIKEQKRLISLIERVNKFKDVDSLYEARQLAEKIIPTKMEVTGFYVGNAKCTIVNRSNLFRISLDSEKEFLCYDFTLNGNLTNEFK